MVIPIDMPLATLLLILHYLHITPLRHYHCFIFHYDITIITLYFIIYTLRHYPLHYAAIVYITPLLPLILLLHYHYY